MAPPAKKVGGIPAWGLAVAAGAAVLVVVFMKKKASTPASTSSTAGLLSAEIASAQASSVTPGASVTFPSGATYTGPASWLQSVAALLGPQPAATTPSSPPPTPVKTPAPTPKKTPTPPTPPPPVQTTLPPFPAHVTQGTYARLMSTTEEQLTYALEKASAQPGGVPENTAVYNYAAAKLKKLRAA
jgi:hypothetical protein